MKTLKKLLCKKLVYFSIKIHSDVYEDVLLQGGPIDVGDCHLFVADVAVEDRFGARRGQSVNGASGCRGPGGEVM